MCQAFEMRMKRLSNENAHIITQSQIVL